MRVAVFRAAADGRRTAARLGDRGYEAVLAPVVRIVPTGVTVRAEDTDGLVFTSAHAPDVLAHHPDGIASIRDLPCWCVGTRTAEAARLAGFTRVTLGGGTAARLAEAIVTAGSASRLTLVAGRDRKPDLERALGSVGWRLSVAEAYAAQAVPSWAAGTVDDLRTVSAALHYSRRSAALAEDLTGAANIGERFRAWTHCCLSADVAAGLSQGNAVTTLVAAKPDDASLLAVLDDLPRP